MMLQTLNHVTIWNQWHQLKSDAYYGLPTKERELAPRLHRARVTYNENKRGPAWDRLTGGVRQARDIREKIRDHLVRIKGYAGGTGGGAVERCAGSRPRAVSFEKGADEG